MNTSYKRQAKYYETDQMSVIHHSNYIRWFEEARVHFLEEIGFPYDKTEEMGLLSPVLEVCAQYKSSIKFHDEVEIFVNITQYTGTRLSFEYEIYNKKTGVLATTGYSKHCFLLKENNKLISIKKVNPKQHEVFLDLVKPQKYLK